MAEFFEALKNSFNDTFGEAVQLGSTSILTLNIVVWSIFIGFTVAIFATVYSKVVVGAFVRSVISKKALDEASALPIKDIGHGNIFVKFALRRGSSLRRIVKVCGDFEDKKIPFDTAGFYIPEENIHRAERIYGSLGTAPSSVIMAIVAFFVLAMAALLVIPDLAQLFVNSVSL